MVLIIPSIRMFIPLVTYIDQRMHYIYTYASFGQYILQRYTLLLLQTSMRDPGYCI